jgi:hypothetical protein
MGANIFDETIQLEDSAYTKHGGDTIMGSDIGDEVANDDCYLSTYHMSLSDFFVPFKGEDIVTAYDASTSTEYETYADITPVAPGDVTDPSVKDLLPFGRHDHNSDGHITVKSTTYGLLNNTGGKAPHGDFDIMTVRGIALRVPLMVAGWGWTNNGASTFSTYDEKLPGSAGWKIAPLDLRFNEERWVWEAGGANSLTDHYHLKATDGGAAYSVLYPAASGEVSESEIVHIIPADLVE